MAERIAQGRHGDKTQARRADAAATACESKSVEPVFGQINKHARGFRQFLLRASNKVRAEWA